MLFNQVPLKILSFFSQHPAEMYCESEIRKCTEVSAGATNQTLRLLRNLDLVEREGKGNLYIYKLNNGNNAVRHFKIFETLVYLSDFVKEIKPHAREIILYGSCAEGMNTANSDIDIFIKTEHKDKVRKIANKYRLMDESIKSIAMSSLEIASSKKTDKVFYSEVRKGIVLWMGEPAYEEV